MSEELYHDEVRILLYREQGTRWYAHALEFNLIGHGDTQNIAVERLFELIKLQFRAAIELKNPSGIFNPAAGKYFAMFAQSDEYVLNAESAMMIREYGRKFDIEIEEYRTREFKLAA